MRREHREAEFACVLCVSAGCVSFCLVDRVLFCCQYFLLSSSVVGWEQWQSSLCSVEIDRYLLEVAKTIDRLGVKSISIDRSQLTVWEILDTRRCF